VARQFSASKAETPKLTSQRYNVLRPIRELARRLAFIAFAGVHDAQNATPLDVLEDWSSCG
jgi:hypothetical protein